MEHQKGSDGQSRSLEEIECGPKHCKYNLVKDVGKSLVCYYTNVQSLRSKFTELLETVKDVKPKIIGLTETWTTNDMYDGELEIKDFVMYRCNRLHGGCILYVHESLTSVPCDDLNNLGFSDSVWCTVKLLGNQRLLIGVCYRSPNSDH